MHARAGNRDSYAPLISQLAPSAPGDALAIARAFRGRLGLRELYIADLDAIIDRAPQRELRRSIAAELADVDLWVDAGIGTADQLREVTLDGATRVIVGLETLPSAADQRGALERLAVAIGLAGPRIGGLANAAWRGSGQSDARRAVFSLDLRSGEPAAADPTLRSLHPLDIAQLAAGSGFGTIIILDLARVGMATGPDLHLLRELRRALPHVELVAGGGIRDAGDLEQLTDEGVDAALVGSALHHGSTGHGSILRACGLLASDVSSPPADD